MSVTKYAAAVLLSEEAIADGRGFLDRWRAVEAARQAARGERYGGVYQRGYQDGADAAFRALLDFLAKGGRVGLPLGADSVHIVSAEGMSAEILSLLALRPFERRADR